MTEKEINWDEVMKETNKNLEKCIALDKQIAEERKNPDNTYDLEECEKDVNKFIEENNLDSVTLELIDEKRKK